MLDADPEQLLPPWRWGWRNWLAVAFFGLVALWVLRPRVEPATVEPMPTVAAKKKPARKPAAKRRAPRQTREEFVAEVKAIAARVDSGEERTYSAKEIERELGL